MTARHVAFIDTSIILAGCLDGSVAATHYIEAARSKGVTIAASRFIQLEATHVVKNVGGDVSGLNAYFSHVSLWLSVDDALLREAAALEGPVCGADAIHLAAALRIAGPGLEFVTHDRQQSTAARIAGLVVVDPVAAEG